jgi:hypothetical protein
MIPHSHGVSRVGRVERASKEPSGAFDPLYLPVGADASQGPAAPTRRDEDSSL